MPARYLAFGITVALSVSSTLAAADAIPTRKAGLWESKTVSPAGNATARQCIDDKTDQFSQGAFGAGQNCSKRNVAKTSTGFIVETECKIGPISATGSSVITGDFSNKIHMEVDTTLTGSPNSKEPVRRRMVIDATYLGPCEAGQSPGDIIMPDGKVIKMPQTAPR